MDKYLKQQIYTWVYNKIKSNPQKFGGDSSNPAIMFEYLLEFYPHESVVQLQQQTMSLLTTVSRIKNKLLKRHPQYDCRIRHRVKANESSGSD